MYVVNAKFTIAPEHVEAFLTLIRAQADNSLKLEPGCHRFDVGQGESAPTEILLYELYTDRAAFDAHLQTPHFAQFDRDCAPMVLAKTVDFYLLLA